jgi:predicted secreted protein
LLRLLLSLFVTATRAKTLLLDDPDDNSQLFLYLGDVLAIKRSANPAAGYRRAKPEPSPALTVLAARSERGSSDRAGAPGFQILSRTATEPGKSTFVPHDLRPFEKNVPPGRVFRASVTIEPRPAPQADSRAKP